MTRVFLIRHALTDFDLASAEGRFCGRSDPPLNSAGRIEAAHLAERIPTVIPYLVFTSPLRRSRETAEITLKNIKASPTIDGRLIEIDYAEWDGLSKGQIQKEYQQAYQNFVADPVLYHPGGSHLVSQCEESAWEWLSSLPPENVIAFTHKTWTRLLLCRIFGIDRSNYRDLLDIKIAGITCLVNNERKWRVDALNYEALPKRIFGGR